ncbi:hypothetical protein MBLNU230_g0532t1 [Neophaeotheca triangularis]
MDSRETSDAPSPVRGVSSLRSRFENLGKDSEAPPSPATSTRQFSWGSQVSNNTVTNGRPRTSAGEGSDASGFSAPGEAPAAAAVPQLAAPQLRKRPGLTPPKPRPESMISVVPSQQSPPMVTVNSPRTPAVNSSVDFRMADTYASTDSPVTASRTGSPTRSKFKVPSQASTPLPEARMSAFFPSEQSQSSSVPPQIPMDSKPKPSSGPPPVNRAGKPAVPKKPSNLGKPSDGLSAPEQAAELTDHSASPFHTPPSSGNNTPGERKTAEQRSSVHSDASFVETIAERARANSNASWVERVRGDSNASTMSSSSLPREGFFQPPPTHHAVTARREQQANDTSRTPPMKPSRYTPMHSRDMSAAGDLPSNRPSLPSRPELQTRARQTSPRRTSPRRTSPGRTSPGKPRSGRTSPLKKVLNQQPSHGPPKRTNTFGESSTPRIPATKAPQKSALSLGFDRATQAPTSTAPPAIPAPRRSMDRRLQIQAETPQAEALKPRSQDNTPTNATNGSHDDIPEPPLSGPGPADFPDSSHANRRPPMYKQRPWQIPTEYDTRLFRVCGEIVCTTGYLTKAWNMRTGEQLLNMAHHENVRVTSLAFKPSASVDDEGKRIWLGTSIGEIHEIDIPSQSLVKTKTGAHTRREIIKMYRHSSSLWTLDDTGDLSVWRADSKGMPSLDAQAAHFRTKRGHSFSIACDGHLWLATGKEVRVYLPSAKSDEEFNVLKEPLTQHNTSDITSGATISSKPDLIYFGHGDGKVSIYDRRNFSCVAVANVSLYKISSMAGVGDYLWAGYNTGMAYVYDTSVTPWRVKKDWQAHDKQICGMIADQSAAWKLDRLQVVSLGTDNMLRIWDGMLEQDWIESQMQQHDSEYCSFREISAAVLTWNAGASKPGQLQYTKEDDNFFRKYLTAQQEPPDVFVFGFQELVDLEDKKVTAKSFFKSKSKAAGEPEHMSHQYRAWRDYLTRSLEDHMPSDTPYTLLHTANMVGLFTCVFVKSSERTHIRHVHTSEVKRGMGGLHGNKGALIMRLVLDDSSVCFINCHLAAGQTQTINRNNDIAAILEAETLPTFPLSQTSAAAHSDVFTSGGDGSMVLDHEICILNGDLNYRIDTMGRDTVVKHIAQRNLPRLLDRDQLLLSRKKNPGFRLRAFRENDITFPPTYKYNVNSDDYDTSEKRRAPAWCDRILYRGLGKVRCVDYRRWEDLRISDHRPVSGFFRLRVKSVNVESRRVAWERCLKEFEAVRGRVWREVQLDYLTNTFGLSKETAMAALKGQTDPY